MMPLSCYAITINGDDIAEKIDLSAKCSLSIKYSSNEISFEGENVELYKVATVSENYTYTLVDDFKDAGVILNGIDSKGEWTTICTTLENYVYSNDIKPEKIAITDFDGGAVFDGLSPGMYLAMPVNVQHDNISYCFGSMLTSLPSLIDDEIVYDADIIAKFDIEENNGEEVNYSVVKLWNDAGYSSGRPNKIVVEIYKNGDLYKSVVLNGDNNWFYSWKGYKDGSIWSVIERNIPDNYISEIEIKDSSFVIINTDTRLIEIPGITDTPDDSDTDENNKNPENPDEPNDDGNDLEDNEDSDTNNNVNGSDESKDENDHAPTGDTSNIGFYMMLMCISGILLILLSFVGKRKID